jgi:tetratricopeptide (TPR) repeat protein
MKRASFAKYSRSLGLSLCLALAAPHVVAQSRTAQAPLSQSLTGMARAEYEAGKILYADGDFTGASLKFQRAYEESKDPRLLWNQAAAEKNLRRYVKVQELVERYVQESGDKLTANDRAEAQALLDTVKAFIGEVTFNVTPEGARIFVDDVEVGTAPLSKPVRVEMGERRLRVEKEGFVPYRASRSFDGGSAATVEVTLEAERHEGTLLVTASSGDTIKIDGKVVGTGAWQGTLPSGLHRVEVSAQGKRTYTSDVMVQNNQSSSISVALESLILTPPPADPERDKGGPNAWLWIGSGVLLAAGLGVGAYFLFRDPKDKVKDPVSGSLAPGVVELGF